MSLYEKREEDVHIHKAASPEPSCVSVKSDMSLRIPPVFSDGAVTSDPEYIMGSGALSITAQVLCPYP